MSIADEELTLTELIAKSRVMHAFLPDDDDRTVNQYTADEVDAAGYRKTVEGEIEWAYGDGGTRIIGPYPVRPRAANGFTILRRTVGPWEEVQS